MTCGRAVRDVAEAHVAGLEKLAGAYLGDRDGIEIVDRDELAARLRRRDLIVLDVRPDAEYQAGHITGARSVPVGELRRHLQALPKGSDVVAYCRGPYCVYADDAVRELNRKGFRAAPPHRRLPRVEASRTPRRRRRRLTMERGHAMTLDDR